MWKKWKKNLTITAKSNAHPHAKFHNNRYKTVRGVALTIGINCLYLKDEKWLSSQCGKSDQNDQTIISKPHAYSHTMKKTYTKFQINQYKTVRGVALTRGTHCLYIEGEKWLNSQCGKSDKKCSNNYTQITCTSSYHEKTYAKFQNNRYKTLRGVSLTRGTHCLYVLTILPKPHGHPHTMKKTHAKFQNNQYKTVRGVALTMTKFTMWKKWQKII